jgi:hypothetical protein
LTKPTAPTEDELEKVDNRFNGETPDLETSESVEEPGQEESVDGSDLTEDEQELLEYIDQYISENDERPSKRRCYTDSAPFGSSKTTRLLDQLLEKNKVQVETVERHGNESQVYSPT